MAMTDPDASGGLGSYSRDLWGILTGTLREVAAPALASRLNLQTTTDANGNIRYAAAPAPERSTAAADTLRDVFTNPVNLVLIGAAVVLVVVLIRR